MSIIEIYDDVPPRAERILDFTESDVDQYDDTEARKQLVRNLVVSGGNPYILVTVTEEGVEVTFQGLEPATVAPGLIELGQALQGQIAEQVSA